MAVQHRTFNFVHWFAGDYQSDEERAGLLRHRRQRRTRRLDLRYGFRSYRVPDRQSSASESQGADELTVVDYRVPGQFLAESRNQVLV